MNDDWRLQVDVHGQGLAHSLSEHLDAVDLEHELESSFQDRVIVSLDDSSLFLYAGAREQAEAAERLVRSLADKHGWELETRLTRWHPEAEAWEDPDVALPGSAPEHEAEHAERVSRDREEAVDRGYPDYEVRIECRTERDAEQFAERLRAEGLQVVRRNRYVVVGAIDEESANALAARAHREAPEGSAVVAEGTVAGVTTGAPLNPFALFGGLGG